MFCWECWLRGVLNVIERLVELLLSVKLKVWFILFLVCKWWFVLRFNMECKLLLVILICFYVFVKLFCWLSKLNCWIKVVNIVLLLLIIIGMSLYLFFLFKLRLLDKSWLMMLSVFVNFCFGVNFVDFVMWLVLVVSVFIIGSSFLVRMIWVLICVRLSVFWILFDWVWWIFNCFLIFFNVLRFFFWCLDSLIWFVIWLSNELISFIDCW